MSGARMVWDGVEYECYRQSIRSLRRLEGTEPDTPAWVLAAADMMAEMVPGAAEVIEDMTLDQLVRFGQEATAALDAASPFTGASDGSLPVM